MTTPQPALIPIPLPCSQCDRDLQGEPLLAPCPECAHPISESVQDSLARWGPAQLQHLSRASFWMAASIPAFVYFQFVDVQIPVISVGRLVLATGCATAHAAAAFAATTIPHGQMAARERHIRAAAAVMALPLIAHVALGMTLLRLSGSILGYRTFEATASSISAAGAIVYLFLMGARVRDLLHAASMPGAAQRSHFFSRFACGGLLLTVCLLLVNALGPLSELLLDLLLIGAILFIPSLIAWSICLLILARRLAQLRKLAHLMSAIPPPLPLPPSPPLTPPGAAPPDMKAMHE